jgi:NDP-sugar pyrophosphorylase family protein
MKAMIFAAGLGTRLRPLTDTCPKALIPLNGKPMLQIVIEQLKRYGFNEIIINVHYLGNQIVEFLQQQHNFGIRIEISDETDQILETGGGLLNAQHFFDDGKPFLVCNADVFTTINLTNFFNAHLENNSIATLAVRNRNSSRYLLFDDNDILFGWENVKSGEIKIPRKPSAADRRPLNDDDEYPLHEFAFSGYHIISPEIFKHCSRTGKFSMTDWYLDICSEHQIKAFHHDDDIWLDIGSLAELEKASELIKSATF